MEEKPDIVKIGAIILNHSGKLLIVRPQSDTWIFVGGKINPGETPEECLIREVQEELNADVISEPVFYVKSPIEPAAGDTQGRTVQISSYFAEISGVPKPSHEIEEVHWLSAEEFHGRKFKLGSVLEKIVIPKLIQDGLMR